MTAQPVTIFELHFILCYWTLYHIWLHACVQWYYGTEELHVTGPPGNAVQ